MIVRVFTENGISEFAKQLQEIRFGSRQDLSRELLTGNNFTTSFDKEIVIDECTFKTKMELIEYICGKLELKGNKHLYYNRGLWSWLGAFYFNSLKSIKSNGELTEDARYILMEPKNYRKYYRHLLASFARVYCELDQLAIPFLSYPIPIFSDLHEQLLSRQEIAMNKPLIEAANKLYWDEKKLKVKKGAGSKNQGSPRRFSDIVGQFELTFDLNAMSYDAILSIFPEQEFKKWHPAA